MRADFRSGVSSLRDFHLSGSHTPLPRASRHLLLWCRLRFTIPRGSTRILACAEACPSPSTSESRMRMLTEGRLTRSHQGYCGFCHLSSSRGIDLSSPPQPFAGTIHKLSYPGYLCRLYYMLLHSLSVMCMPFRQEAECNTDRI
jgi:hypothetical protein